MPTKFTLYDLVEGITLVRAAVTAKEAVQNDPDRYALTEPGSLAAQARKRGKAENRQ